MKKDKAMVQYWKHDRNNNHAAIVIVITKNDMQ